MKKIKIKKILKKKGKKPIVCLTAYSSTMAKILDKFCDIILVGDSVSMVLYGMKTTKEIKIDTLILHAKAVKKMCKRSLVVFDMPYNTYQSKTLAFKNAKKVIKQTNCDATPICLTVDFETLEDSSVTVRDRDTMKQDRVSIENLSENYKKYFSTHNRNWGIEIL